MSSRSAIDIWEKTLGALQVQVSRASFSTWLRGTFGISYQGEEFVVGAPNAFCAEWLQTRMASVIEETLMNILKHPVRLSVRVAETEEAKPSGTARALVPTPAGGAPTLLEVSPLNPHYTFNTFVSGDGNQLAYAAALAVSQQPGHVYNPLFLHGDAGLGKTHLLHAIAHAAAARGLHPIVVTAERFVTEFVESIRTRGHSDFRRKYRAADILAIDDFQFLIGKEQSLETLLHLFNELREEGRQIIVSCDRPPHSLPGIGGRLISRFQAGLLIQLVAPSLETRLAILQAKAASLPFPLDDAVLSLLAHGEVKSVRELEGSLTRLQAYATLAQRPPTEKLVQALLREDTPPLNQTRIPAAAILAAVSSYSHVSETALIGKARDAATAYARNLAIHLLYQHAGLSLRDIARMLGNRDANAIRNSLRRVSTTLAQDPHFRQDSLTILSSLS
ncbi:MAG: chromosomal replication initiator protein DnaA [Chloroflexi bacterium]|nr:chromosomal replication initiator protein DnaA [Chloroflexota bacterium]